MYIFVVDLFRENSREVWPPALFSLFFPPGKSTEACRKKCAENNLSKTSTRNSAYEIFPKKKFASGNHQKWSENGGNSTILISGAIENLGLRWILTGSRQSSTDARRFSPKVRRFSAVSRSHMTPVWLLYDPNMNLCDTYMIPRGPMCDPF